MLAHTLLRAYAELTNIHVDAQTDSGLTDGAGQRPSAAEANIICMSITNLSLTGCLAQTVSVLKMLLPSAELDAMCCCP